MPVDNLDFGLGMVATILGVAVIFRLYHTGLHACFRVLTWFLCFDTVRKFALFTSAMSLHPRQNYAWTWLTTEAIAWIFYILLAFEFCSLVLRNYGGLWAFRRWAFSILVPLFALVAALAVLASRDSHRANPVLFFYLSIGGGIMLSLAILILATLFLVSRRSISLSRNLAVHAGVCAFLMLGGALSNILRIVEGAGFNHAMNTASQVLTVLCWATWLFLLTPRGEQPVVAVP